VKPSLFSIVLAFLFLFTIILQVVFDESLAQHEFKKLEVLDAHPDASMVTANLLRFFKGEVTTVDSRLSAQEVSHLYDVKNIIQVMRVIQILLAVVFFVLLVYEYTHTTLSYSSFLHVGILLVCVCLFFLMMVITFSTSFTLFHEVLFTNNNWLLPHDSLLIELYPEQFFYDYLWRIIQEIALILAGLGVAGGMLMQAQVLTRVRT